MELEEIMSERQTIEKKFYAYSARSSIRCWSIYIAITTKQNWCGLHLSISPAANLNN